MSSSQNRKTTPDENSSYPSSLITDAQESVSNPDDDRIPVGASIENTSCWFLKTDPPPPLVGDSTEIKQLQRRIDEGARSELNLLIVGEGGTGKSLAARAVHARSRRSEHPLLVVNCATLDPNRLGSTLLGKDGALAHASGGTLLLDHVDELDGSSQARLDHILHSAVPQSSKSKESRSSGIRLIGIATTPKFQNRLRRRLYFRLAQLPLATPPLRERRDDIPAICRHFLQQHPPDDARQELTFSSEALETLQDYSWPGNVRQLRNVVRRAAFLADEGTITPSDLLLSSTPTRSLTTEDGPDDQDEERTLPGPANAPEPDEQDRAQVFPETSDASSCNRSGIPTIEELKKQAVKRAYELCDENVDHAAVELGIGRSTMYRMLDRYDIR